MAEPITESWRELRRPSQAECPKLFYNLGFIENELYLQLTDLVAIWHCSLNKQEVIESAKVQRASIDPSQSNSQLQVLFQKFEQGLRSDDNLLYHDKDIESQVVHLRTHIELPHPLKPLTWIFKLAPQPATELAEHLLRPCLFEASTSKKKLESLQNVIREKDHVLSRLFERIEATSTDLSMIFPGITGLKSRRGRVTVREAEKHVPGMKSFDAQAWASHFHTDNPYAGYDQKGINNLVAGCERCPAHSAKDHFGWLKNLPVYGSKNTKGPRLLGKIGGTLNARFGPTDGNKSTASEDDFEEQPTLSNFRRKRSAEESQPHSMSSSATLHKRDDTAAKDISGHLAHSEHPVEDSKQASFNELRPLPTASQRPSEHRRASSSSTASETQSDLEPNIDMRRGVPQDNEPELSPPPDTDTAKQRLAFDTLQTSSDDDDDDLDLDMDSQSTKPARKSNSRSTKTLHHHTETRTPPPPVSSTPSRRSSHPGVNSTPQTNPQTTPRSEQAQNPPSDPSTPSKTRRLGRLGTSQSHSLSPQTQSRFFNRPPGPSLTFSPEGQLDTSPHEDNTVSFLSTTTDPDVEVNRDVPPLKPPAIPEPKISETASEAANRRRQELKRKLEPVKQERKKRKF